MKLYDYLPKDTFFQTLLFTAIISMFPVAISLKILSDIGSAIATIGQNDTNMPHSPLYYLGLVMIMMLMSMASRFLMSRFKEDMMLSLRQQFLQRVVNSTLQNIEKIGAAKMYNLLTSDIGNIGSLLATMPNILFSCTLILAGFAYIAYMSLTMFLMLIVLTLVSVVISGLMQRLVNGETVEELRLKDELYQSYESVIYGKKELSLSFRRTSHLLSHQLDKLLLKLKEKVIKIDLIWSAIMTFGDSTVLFLILSLLLLADNPDSEALSITVLIIFYLRGPVSVLMSSLPQLAYSNVSIKRLNIISGFNNVPFEAKPAACAVVDQLTYKNIEFSYLNDNFKTGFALGPINVTFRKGEITMINGGNGSGKSTLCKIISGLYPDFSGDISLNDSQASDPQTIRSLFSCQMFDYYLFPNLPVIDGQLTPEQQQFIALYLDELELFKHTSLEGDKWRTIDLSSGQKRRLALISTLFEDKPVVLFDEWAADQDPHFRRFFYETLLPRLAAQGKVVIVVSHDEHYFSCADKIYTLFEGRLIQSQDTTSTQLSTTKSQ
jgi:cyclic peptide transporter